MNEVEQKRVYPDPVYCGDCRKNGTWVRYPQEDWKTESGIITEKAFKCSGCGGITFRPTPANYQIGD